MHVRTLFFTLESTCLSGLNHWVFLSGNEKWSWKRPRTDMEANIHRSPARYYAMVDWTSAQCGHCLGNLHLFYNT